MGALAIVCLSLSLWLWYLPTRLFIVADNFVRLAALRRWQVDADFVSRFRSQAMRQRFDKIVRACRRTSRLLLAVGIFVSAVYIAQSPILTLRFFLAKLTYLFVPSSIPALLYFTMTSIEQDGHRYFFGFLLFGGVSRRIGRFALRIATLWLLSIGLVVVILSSTSICGTACHD
jgi:hypothetical protein